MTRRALSAAVVGLCLCLEGACLRPGRGAAPVPGTGEQVSQPAGQPRARVALSGTRARQEGADRSFQELFEDADGRPRPDLWQRGIDQIRRMAVAAPPGAEGSLIWKWKPIGPRPMVTDGKDALLGNPMAGAVVDVAIDPTGPDIVDRVVYIATNVGGVWKTTDGGAEWEPLTEAMPSLSIGAVVLDPVNPDIVYAGTGSLFDGAGFQHSTLNQAGAIGIYKSFDGGQNWTILNPGHIFDGVQINRMVMPAANVLLVGTRYGLFRSVDGGLHFGNNGPAYDNGQDIAIGGLGGQFISDLRRDTVDANVVYAAVDGRGLFKSVNAGALFGTNLFDYPGAPSWGTYGYVAFAQSFRPDNTAIYALVQDAYGGGILGLYRFDTTATTWEQRAAVPTYPAFGCQCPFDQVIGVDPRNGQRVLLGLVDLWLSTDGGATLQIVNAQVDPADPTKLKQWWVHEDFHAIAFSPPSHWGIVKKVRTWVGNDGGVAVSTNPSLGWTNLNKTIATIQLLSLDIGTGASLNRYASYGGAWDTGVMRRGPGGTDSGDTRVWRSNLSGDGGPVAVEAFNAATAYATSNGWLYKTTTAGRDLTNPANSWFPPAASGLQNAPVGALVVDKSTDWVYVSQGTSLYRSRDHAASFELVGTFSQNISRVRIEEYNHDAVWVGLGDGSLEYTYDAYPSAAWTHVAIPDAPAQGVSGVEVFGDEVFVVYPGFCGDACPDGLPTRHIFYSADKGAHWTDISGNLPDLPLFSVVLDRSYWPTKTLMVAGPGGVLSSTNLGGLWQVHGIGIPAVNVFQIAINRDTTPAILRVGTYGRSAFELTSCMGPDATVLQAPLAGATGVLTTPLLDWSAVTGGISYDVEVYTHLLLQGPGAEGGLTGGGPVGIDVSGWSLVRQAHVRGHAWKIPAPQALHENTTYSWRARANNACGPGPWSDMSDFLTCATPATPTLVSPADGDSGLSTTPTLSWGSVTGATSYRVQVCTDPACSSVVRKATRKLGRTGPTQWTVWPALAKHKRYSWRVQASSACGTSGWSSTHSFTTGLGIGSGY